MQNEQLMTRRRLAPLLATAMMAALSLVVGGTTSSVVAADDCQGYIYDGIDSAKNSFRDECGRSWNDQVRDQCTWVSEPTAGWVCHTYAANGPVNPQAPPTEAPPSSSRTSTAPSARSRGATDLSAYWTKELMEGATDIYSGQAVSTSSTASGVSTWFQKTTGRLFFEMPHISSGRFSCTASVVNSNGKNNVWTAGHCLHLAGAWATNVMFAPGYSNGDAPYGEWTARQLWSVKGWTDGGQTGNSCGSTFSSGDPRYDLGVVVLYPLNGQSIANVVGGNGLRLDGPTSGSATAIAYERGSSSDGCGGTATEARNLVSCSSQIDTFGFSGIIGVTCPQFGAGSSGGGIFTSVNGDGRYLSGIVAFGSPELPGVHLSGYFGDAARNLRDATANS